MTDRSKLERALTMRLGPASRAWQRLADSELSPLNLSESSARALAYLDRLGPDTRQGELARAINVAEPSLVPTIRALERSGYVNRLADKDDRRAYRLRLTQAGTELAAKIDQRLVALRSEMLADVPDEVLHRIIDVLDGFTGRIDDRRRQP